MFEIEKTANCIEVHSRWVLLWMVHIKGYKILSKHREPKASLIGTITYKEKWLVEPD